MTDGRRVHGDGIENVQDAVQERLTYGSSTDELADANRRLEQEQADLQQLHRGETTTPQRQPDTDALVDEANTPSGRMDVRGNPGESPSGSMTGIGQKTPEAEARDRMLDRINDGNG